MMKKIAILGSTGSIGTQTLEVVRYNKDIQVTALAAGSNVKLLEEQIREFKPRLACLWDEEKAKEAAKGLNNANGFIKHEVNSRIKMRRIPDFHFIADDSTEYSAGIAKILNSLDIRHDDEEGTEEE